MLPHFLLELIMSTSSKFFAMANKAGSSHFVAKDTSFISFRNGFAEVTNPRHIEELEEFIKEHGGASGAYYIPSDEEVEAFKMAQKYATSSSVGAQIANATKAELEALELEIRRKIYSEHGMTEQLEQLPQVQSQVQSGMTTAASAVAALTPETAAKPVIAGMQLGGLKQS